VTVRSQAVSFFNGKVIQGITEAGEGVLKLWLGFKRRTLRKSQTIPDDRS
jgi:hypothetical protein